VANVRDLRRRIRSVGNTMQLTRAMKMVSAAKLRRSQEAMVRARPYADAQRRILLSLARRAKGETHPLLADRGDRRVELVVMSGDKGLCGSFNANIIRRAQGFLDERAAGGDAEITLHLVGKKGVDYFGRRWYAIHKRYVDAFRAVSFATAREIADDLIGRFTEAHLDAIYLVYNEFKSAISHRVVAQRLLPLGDLEDEEREGETDSLEYIYEPDATTLLRRLLPQYVETQVYRAMLESSAAEHGARMSAMDSATRNAEEMIRTLTLHMNRVRQASITTEIIEVVSGAQALD
jgi:F-type H+-transporting ATPase subunit gamma